MKIKNVTCTEVSKDVEGVKYLCNLPYIISETSLSRTIVNIESKDGITGFSVIPGFHGKFIAEALKPLLLGKDPSFIKKLWEEMYSSQLVWNGNYTLARNVMQPGEWESGWLNTGVAGSIAAVDIALYDLVGKANNLPVYQLLGGYRKQVPAYADGQVYPDFEMLEKTYGRYIEHGYKMVKVHIQPYFGEDPVQRIFKQTELVRKAIGDDVKLGIDFFSRYSPEIASKGALAIEEFSPFWIEDPVYRDDLLQGLKRVRDTVSGRMNICAGERVRTLYDARNMLESGGVDIVNIYQFGIGGITPWMKVAVLAEANHVRINTYGGVALEVQCHLVAAAPNALAVDTLPLFCPIVGGYRWSELFIEPIEPESGYIEMPEKPGLGVELNEKEIEKYTIAEY